MTDCPPEMFSPTLAAAGTGKAPSVPWIVSVRPGMGAPVVGGADDVTGRAEALEPEAAGLEAAELAVGVPAEHAATVRLAAVAARASAAERNLFIAFLHSVGTSPVPTLDAPPTKLARFAASPWHRRRFRAGQASGQA